jgi:hypothetical protein
VSSLDLTSFLFARKKISDVAMQPIPYFTLRLKLMDEESAAYTVGQLISAMV